MGNKNGIKENLDIILAVTGAIAATALIIFTYGLSRIVLGSAFILFIPGYSLIAALFTNKRSLNLSQRLVLSITSSICIVSLGGLVLSFTPWGLRLVPAIIFILIFVLFFSFFTLLRRHRIPPEERFNVVSIAGGLGSIFENGNGYKKSKITAIALILAVIISIIFVLELTSTNSEAANKDEFYILPAGVDSPSYPRTASEGDIISVNAVIVNHQSETADYFIKVIINGIEISKKMDIRLPAGRKSETTISFSAANPGSNQQVEYVLFNSGNDQPVNRLYIWIDVYNK